jgi:hypothetical protein
MLVSSAERNTEMRNGLSYEQASANSNRKAVNAYKESLANGASLEEATEVAFKSYEAEMKWYEGK